MSKNKIKFICSSCGFDSPKWLGKCPSCEEWNSFTEELVEEKKGSSKKINSQVKVQKLNELTFQSEERIATNLDEFDRGIDARLSSADWGRSRYWKINFSYAGRF